LSAAQRDFSRLAGWLGAHTDLGGACRITGVGQPKTVFSADTVMLTVDPGASAPIELAFPGLAGFVAAGTGIRAAMLLFLLAPIAVLLLSNPREGETHRGGYRGRSP